MVEVDNYKGLPKRGHRVDRVCCVMEVKRMEIEEDFELKVSRSLIRYFREWLEQCECECDTDVHFCGRCAMIGRIDADLATIRSEVKA